MAALTYLHTNCTRIPALCITKFFTIRPFYYNLRAYLSCCLICFIYWPLIVIFTQGCRLGEEMAKTNLAQTFMHYVHDENGIVYQLKHYGFLRRALVLS